MPVICLGESSGRRRQLSVKVSWECLHITKNTKAETQCVTACVNEGGGEGNIREQEIENVVRKTITKCFLVLQIKV